MPEIAGSIASRSEGIQKGVLIPWEQEGVQGAGTGPWRQEGVQGAGASPCRQEGVQGAGAGPWEQEGVQGAGPELWEQGRLRGQKRVGAGGYARPVVGIDHCRPSRLIRVPESGFPDFRYFFLSLPIFRRTVENKCGTAGKC